MSIVEQKAGVMPRNAATRDAHVRLGPRTTERSQHAVDVVAADAAVVDRVLCRLEAEAHGADAGQLAEAREADARDGV
jgi:hypothetical protein